MKMIGFLLSVLCLTDVFIAHVVLRNDGVAWVCAQSRKAYKQSIEQEPVRYTSCLENKQKMPLLFG